MSATLSAAPGRTRASSTPTQKPLFLAVVPRADGAFAYLVEDRPPDEWADTLRKNARRRFHFTPLPKEVMAYVARDPLDLPRDYLALLAFSYGRGVQIGLHADYTFRTIELLRCEPHVLHFNVYDTGPELIKRLIEETRETDSFGYALSAILKLGEEHAKNDFPPLYPETE